MRVLIQRVSEASVTIEKKVEGAIGKGFVLLVGVEDADTKEDINWLVRKIVNMRIFGDENDQMNVSIQDIDGEFLVISQFTLYASTKKGNRPSYIKAASPDKAIPMYEDFIASLREASGLKIETGIFGADMKVQLINDGPVTIWLDSKEKV